MLQKFFVIVALFLGDETQERRLAAMLDAHEREHEIQEFFSFRNLPEDMKPRADLHVLDVRHIIVQSSDIDVEVLAFLDRILEMAERRLLAHDFLYRCQIVRLHRTEMNVLVERLFKLLQLVESARKLHRRRKMADEARCAAPFCLYALADNRDPVGIYVGQIAERDIGIAFVRERRTLARQPLQRAVRADVDDGVRLPQIAQPVIKADVVMRGRGVGRMQQLARILAEAARRLHREKDIAVERAGHEQRAVVVEHLARRFAPILSQMFLDLLWQRLEESFILRRRKLSVGILYPLFTHEAAVIRRVIRKNIHELLAALRHEIDAIARLTHSREEAAHALWRVKPRRTADVRIRRRIVVKDDGYLLLAVRLMAQIRPLLRLSRQTLHALLKRRIARRSRLIEHLRRNRHGMKDAVELRHTDAEGHLHRVETRRRPFPFFLGRKHRIRLKKRHAERIEVFDARAARLDGKLHRRDDGVDDGLPVATEVSLHGVEERRRLHALVAIRIGKDCDGIEPLRLYRTNQCRVIGEVPCNPLRTIEDDADRPPVVTTMRGMIALNVLTIAVPIGVVYAVPRQRARRLRLSRKSELFGKMQQEIFHILLAVAAEILPSESDFLCREVIADLVMLGIVHENQMRRTALLQSARRLLQEGVIQPCAHPEE